MSAGGGLTNAELAARLGRIADLLELTDANAFRVRAYRTAAESVAAHPVPLVELRSSGTSLTTLAGVGADLARTLAELIDEGRSAQLEELERQVPVGLLEVRRVPGVGPKRAAAVWRALGVTSLDELERAARSDRLAAVAGFGARSQVKVLEGIERVRVHASRHLYVAVEGAAARLLEVVRGAPGVERAECAGSLRRGAATVGDVDLVAAASDPEPVMATFQADDAVTEVLATDATTASVLVAGGVRVDLRVVERGAFGAALLQWTGSRAHVVALRARAQERGLLLTEDGLFEQDDAGSTGRRLAGATEEEVYRALGLSVIPPELREGRGEVAAAADGRLPNPVTGGDIRGDLHLHTTWSDGTAPLDELVAACARLGYEYMAVTDHSQALRMTGGLDEAKLARQAEALDELEATDGARPSGIDILRGLEVDVLRDGSLDLSDEWLERLDLVVVSVHSAFDLARTAQTDRVVRALSHPQVNVLAHPTGRLLGRRDPIDIDLGEVFAAAAANGVAVELNASPHRLDLGDAELMQASAAGCRVSIATDAHALTALLDMRYGVMIARRAGLEPATVINSWPLDRLRAFLRKEEAPTPSA